MPRILLQNFNMGGIADSRLLGTENSVAEMVGLDIHSDPGFVSVHQKLVRDETAPIIGSLIKVVVVASTGQAFYFSYSSGYIYRRKDDGTWNTAYNNPFGGVFGALEYNGYIYFATQNTLHRIAVSNTTITTWQDVEHNWQTFTNGDGTYHPMLELNGVLYIGDRNVVAQVDEDSIFSADALDLPVGYRITCFGRSKTDLLIGTIKENAVNECSIFKWNTWSVSFSSEDWVPESGINSFVLVDNAAFTSVGKRGNLYEYDGSSLVMRKKIPGEFSTGGQSIIYPQAMFVEDNISYFGVSNYIGNPVKAGIWSWGSYSPDYPKVLNCDYAPDFSQYPYLKITTIMKQGTDTVVSWISTPEEYGYTYFSIVDLTLKCEDAYLITRQISIDRTMEKEFRISINYTDLPNGTSFKVYYKTNYETDFVEITDMLIDTDAKVITSKTKVKGNTVQFKVAPQVSLNLAPTFESIEITY